MAPLRVLLNFTHSSDHVLEETAGHVLAGMLVPVKTTNGISSFATAASQTYRLKPVNP